MGTEPSALRPVSSGSPIMGLEREEFSAFGDPQAQSFPADSGTEDPGSWLCFPRRMRRLWSEGQMLDLWRRGQEEAEKFKKWGISLRSTLRMSLILNLRTKEERICFSPRCVMHLHPSEGVSR